jgi:glycosyltransferase involved in cell wall biosynthesis
LNVTFIMGARDTPTDGVYDFVEQLSSTLRQQEISCSTRIVTWDRDGWFAALRQLRRSPSSSDDVAVIQYTHLAWSRRGLPIGAWFVLRLLRRHSARTAVVIHDPSPFPGSRLRDRFRRWVQEATVRRIATDASCSFSTLDPAMVPCLQRVDPAPRFLPAGSNVPTVERVRPSGPGLIIAVFGVTERNESEARTIAEITNRVAASVSGVVLKVFGRGALDAEGTLSMALKDEVDLQVSDVRPAPEVAVSIAGSDAMLFVRGDASSRRGTIMAAVANGLPVVAIEGPETDQRLREAGLCFFRPGELDVAAAHLARIALDPAFADDLRDRQDRALFTSFSWSRIAQTLVEGLSLEGGVRGASSSG